MNTNKKLNFEAVEACSLCAMTHALLFGRRQERRTQPTRMHSTASKVWWRRNNSLGFFSGFGWSHLVLLMGNVKAYIDIFYAIICFQHCCNSLRMALAGSSLTVPRCTKQTPLGQVCCGGYPMSCTASWPQTCWIPLGWIRASIASQAC